MKDALIVFAKRPVPGAVKTRLTATLTPEDAARLYEAFLRDALIQYTDLDADVRLYLSPPAGPLPEDLVAPTDSVHLQQGPGLGARMKMAFVETFATGYERLMIIGTDHPTLPTGFIRQGFDVLRTPKSICIGPSDDGGFYLLGMNDFYPELFHDMRYSHDSVFVDTLQRAALTDAMTVVLPPWYDVDTPETLRRLALDLEDPTVEATHTRRVFDALLETYPILTRTVP